METVDKYIILIWQVNKHGDFPAGNNFQEAKARAREIVAEEHVETAIYLNNGGKPGERLTKFYYWSGDNNRVQSYGDLNH